MRRWSRILFRRNMNELVGCDINILYWTNKNVYKYIWWWSTYLQVINFLDAYFTFSFLSLSGYYYVTHFIRSSTTSTWFVIIFSRKKHYEEARSWSSGYSLVASMFSQSSKIYYILQIFILVCGQSRPVADIYTYGVHSFCLHEMICVLNLVLVVYGHVLLYVCLVWSNYWIITILVY